MHRSLVLLAALLLGVEAVAVAHPGINGVGSEQSLPLEELLARVQATYRGLSDLSARFRQTIISRPGSRPNVTEGTWKVRTPGRLRVEYDSTARLFVVDGQASYFFLPEDNQVQVYDSDSRDPSGQPILYLTGEGDLSEDFQVSGIEWGELLVPGNIQMRLQPRAEDAAFTHLVLEVDPGTALIARLVVLGLLGESTEFSFFDVETNVGLADELFQFTIPPGAQVEHVGQ